MDYLKWNCYDLAEQREQIEQYQREITEFYEELRTVHRQLNEEIASNFNMGDALGKLLIKIENTIAELRAEQNALDEAIDIYFAAETLANEQSEGLPTRLLPKSQSSGTAANSLAWNGTAEAQETIGRSVIMEDWLAALLHRHKNN